MDFLTYIKKMQEIDILEYLLLTNDQVEVFNFVSKPSINNNKLDILTRIEHKYDNDDKFFAKKEIESIHESYTNLNKERENPVNTRLIQLANLEIEALAKFS